MKGIVVDLKERYAVVINNQGEFIQIRNDGKLKVGHEVDVPVKVIAYNNRFLKLASIAAILLFIISLSVGAYKYIKPYSYIDIDINPSVEMTTNIFDRVIRVKGLNEDGEKIINKIKFKHKKVEEGIDILLDSAVENGYIHEDDDNVVMLTVSGQNTERLEQLRHHVRETTVDKFEKAGITGEVIAEKTTAERRHEAIQMGISPGKLSMINELLETVKGDDNIERGRENDVMVEELENMSVKEIRETIKQAKERDKTKGNPNKEVQNNKGKGNYSTEREQDENESSGDEEKTHKNNEKNIKEGLDKRGYDEADTSSQNNNGINPENRKGNIPEKQDKEKEDKSQGQEKNQDKENEDKLQEREKDSEENRDSEKNNNSGYKLDNPARDNKNNNSQKDKGKPG